MTERFVLKFGVGAAILSVAVFALCTLGLARTPWLLLSTAVVMALVACVDFGAAAPAVPDAWTMPERLVFWAVILPFAILYIVNAAAPEISPDGSYYHLGLVRRYLNHGGFYRITTDLFANFTQGCEMLFLVAYAVGKHSAAALIHCAFLLALPAALVAYGRRVQMQTAGVIAALLVFVSPVVGIDGSSAYVDVALAFAGFLCFYALERSTDSRMLLVAGLLAGFCFAIKYTGVAAICYAVIIVFWQTRSFRKVMLVLLPSALVAIPWLVKNWIVVANPFSPFFNRVFPNPYIHVAFEDSLREAMHHLSGYSLGWGTPFELTLGGGLLQGTLGPAFLLAPLGLLALRNAHGRRALGAAALFGLPWFSNIGTRFLIPALPFVALSMGITLSRWPRLALTILVLNAIACWPWVLGLYCAPFNWRLTRFPVSAALRLSSENEFLDKYAPEVRFARLVQEKIPATGVVYTAQPLMTSYTDRTILLNYAAALNSRLEQVLATPIKPELQPTTRVTFTFPAQSVAKVRWVATGDEPAWSIHELSAGLRPTYAEPNRWDASLAGDGRLVTSWEPWDRVRPGMAFEARTEGEGPTELVSFTTRPLDRAPSLRLDGEMAAGGWRTLSAAPKVETGIAVSDLRAEATAELRRCGVTHVLIHDAEPLGPDFRAKTEQWDVDFIGEATPLRLYAIRRAKSIDRTGEVRNNTN